MLLNRFRTKLSLMGLSVILILCGILTLMKLRPADLPPYFVRVNPFLSSVQKIKYLGLKQSSDTVKAVSQLIELPDEDPVVATVSDVGKLTGQQFFTKAEDGDKVLFYPDTKLAILYRPSTNKLIYVAALNVIASEQDQNESFIQNLR